MMSNQEKEKNDWWKKVVLAALLASLLGIPTFIFQRYYDRWFNKKIDYQIAFDVKNELSNFPINNKTCILDIIINTDTITTEVNIGKLNWFPSYKDLQGREGVFSFKSVCQNHLRIENPINKFSNDNKTITLKLKLIKETPKPQSPEHKNSKVIEGRFVDNNGSPLSGIKVWCRSCPNKEKVKTNNNGDFFFIRKLSDNDSVPLKSKICFDYKKIYCKSINSMYLDEIDTNSIFKFIL